MNCKIREFNGLLVFRMIYDVAGEIGSKTRFLRVREIKSSSHRQCKCPKISAIFQYQIGMSALELRSLRLINLNDVYLTPIRQQEVNEISLNKQNNRKKS